MPREDEIRVIAYNIWQEEGCVHGKDCEHWLRAEVIWEEKQKKQPPAKGTGGVAKQAVAKKGKDASKAARTKK